MIKFCSASTLTTKEKKLIHDKMSRGGMKYVFKYKIPKQKMALLYRHKKLVAWATLSLIGYMGDMRPYVGAFTREEYRGKGYAALVCEQLLKHHNIPKDQEIRVYSNSMCKILETIEYDPCLCQWNIDGMNKWTQKNGIKHAGN